LPNSAPSRNSGKELRQKACRADHEGLGPVREQRLVGKQRRDRSGERREQQHAPAPKGERDQQAEPNQDPEEP
jgi:hypothetical protein